MSVCVYVCASAFLRFVFSIILFSPSGCLFSASLCVEGVEWCYDGTYIMTLLFRCVNKIYFADTVLIRYILLADFAFGKCILVYDEEPEDSSLYK